MPEEATIISYSDKNAYGSEHEAVDLGKQFDQPRIDGDKPDGQAAHSIAESASPQEQRHGSADPQMFDRGRGDYWPEPTNSDDINDGAWAMQGERYSPKF
jgi:hypothetical protein